MWRDTPLPSSSKRVTLACVFPHRRTRSPSKDGNKSVDTRGRGTRTHTRTKRSSEHIAPPTPQQFWRPQPGGRALRLESWLGIFLARLHLMAASCWMKFTTRTSSGRLPTLNCSTLLTLLPQTREGWRGEEREGGESRQRGGDT